MDGLMYRHLPSTPGSYTYATEGTPSARGPYVDSIRSRIAFGSTDIPVLIGNWGPDLSPRSEECAKQRRGLLGEQSARHLGPVVQARLGEHVEHASGRSGLGIVGREDHPRDTSQHD